MTQWALAHQRVRPWFAEDGEHVICTANGALATYLSTRGDRKQDAYAVTTVRAGG